MSINPELLRLALQPARAYGEPCGKGTLRSVAEDFVVDEIGLAEPAGQGEHAWLLIRKRHTNTDWVAGQLARLANVPRQHVSYAGRKDRHALTTQWFSVHLPGKPDPDWSVLNSEDIQVLACKRHTRKLKRGALRGNRFRVRIRQLDADPACLAERLQRIAAQGVPNYFGPQRFGRDAGNLSQALALFGGARLDRSQRELALSAARGLLFNAILDARVRAGNWRVPVEGDICIKDGRHGFFDVSAGDDSVLSRLQSGEIHLAATLWGRQGHQPHAVAAAIEAQALAGLGDWCEGLARRGLESERRTLRVNVAELDWYVEAGVLEIGFSLVAGAFATVVLREILALVDAGTDEAA